MEMFCYQCEQTAKGIGCTKAGVCGKDATTAALQDLLLYITKGISMYAHLAYTLTAHDQAVDVFVVEALFSTVTNVDFDPERLVGLIKQASIIRDKAKTLYLNAAKQVNLPIEALDGPATWQPASDSKGLLEQAVTLSITKRKENQGDDVTGLQELILYGLKGAAAYADHAHILGKDDDGIYSRFHATLNFLTMSNPNIDELLSWVLKTGELNYEVMALLDSANTDAYGHPEPTKVLVTPIKGKAIVVSGHDLKDLEALLKQTEGTGINIYTHGEMLPANAYPGLKKYKHLVGNYGGAWQDQAKEFDAFPGAILMTTNCIQKPRDSYKDRIFTSGLVAWPGIQHVNNTDFSAVISAALAAPGFPEDAPEQSIIVGFGHNAVMGVANTVIDAVKEGKVRHFFLIGGCDGAKSGRNYYTELAQKVPQDCIILTLACGKYRFNKLEFGEIGGIPRLLDIGQCNDAYSALQISLALASAFQCGVNELPLSLILSWYEQKAVAILLTLLYLGIKNIRIGPSLPAFITPPVLNVLVEKFNLKPISTPEADLQAILG